MRADGLSKLDCVFVMVHALGLQLPEAANRVHLSSTWADRRESDERAQGLLCDVLEALPPVIYVGELDEHFRRMERDST